MARVLALPAALLAMMIIMLPAGQRPENNSEQPDAFDIEPPILKGNLAQEPSPAAGTPDAEVARLEKQLERAKKNAEGAEHLWKIGVLAKVEVEQRVLRVIRCESGLANARLVRAKQELGVHEPQVITNQNSKQELKAAKAELAQLTEAAQIAAQKRERAELEAAEANLHRQQKLLKMGSAKKSDVDRAEEKLAELKAPKN